MCLEEESRLLKRRGNKIPLCRVTPSKKRGIGVGDPDIGRSGG